MSLVFNWFWSEKVVDGKQAQELHKSLFKEMKQLFYDYDITQKAELYYDDDEVLDILHADLDAIAELSEKCVITEVGTIFPSDKVKREMHVLCTKYFDHVVEYKRFIEDNSLLRTAVAKKMLEYALLDKFVFDWHYWQLFRRNIQEDIFNAENAIDIIENGPEDSDDEDDELNLEVKM